MRLIKVSRCSCYSKGRDRISGARLVAVILPVAAYGHHLTRPNVEWKTFVVHRRSCYIQKRHVTQEDNPKGAPFGDALPHPLVHEYSDCQYLQAESRKKNNDFRLGCFILFYFFLVFKKTRNYI